MGFPAARISDMHVCPMVTPGVPPIPHVGGPILPPIIPTVLIGGLPAAVVSSMCVCVGPPDSIVKGSIGVFIGGMPAARMGDPTAHGGMVAMGCPTVLIGDIGGTPSLPGGLPAGAFKPSVAVFQTKQGAAAAQVVTLRKAAKNGTPFCEKCAAAASAAKAKEPAKEPTRDAAKPAPKEPPKKEPTPKPKSNFEKYQKKVFKHEGGYVNDPNDPGGATNKGITIGTFKAHAQKDLGIEPTLENLKNLTNEQAAVIYKKNYWDTVKGDDIKNGSLAYAIYDFNVNAGGNAVKVLQKTLNEMGAKLPITGHLGDKTLAEVNKMDAQTLFDNYQENRKEYYQAIIKHNPKLKKFEKGWNNRVDSIDFEE